MKAIHHDLLQEGRHVPWTKLCAVLGVPRSSAYYIAKEKTPRRMIDPVLEKRIKDLIETQAAFGIRSVWSWLRFVDGLQINRKKVERIMRLKRWTLKARRAGQRPRVQASRSIAETPNQRWATDIALVHCGTDGWCAMVPVIDCCTREILGWELDRTARAKTAERALEGALLSRFGWLHGAPPGLALRHDNGLVFGSRLYSSTVRRYGLRQEYIAPYTPEQNGLCERFIRTLKEQCVWLHRFSSLQHARSVIANWIIQYNSIRPHQSLDYLSPIQYLNSLLCQNAA